MENAELLIHEHIYPALIASYLAAKYLQPNGGALMLVGSLGVLEKATPERLIYGIVKNAEFQLIRSLVVNTKDAGLPSGARVIGILPRILYTFDNEKKGAKHEFATPVDVLAQKMAQWMSDTSVQGILTVETKNDETMFVPMNSLLSNE